MRFHLALVMLAGLGALTMVAPPRAAAQQQTPSRHELQQIRNSGYNAGYQAGLADHRGHDAYDFQRHNDYRNARARYRDNEYRDIDASTFEMGFRNGYESGYDDAFYGRSDDPGAMRDREYGAYSNAPGYAAGAQPARRAGNEVPSSGVLRAGTTLDLRLNNTLSTRIDEHGDAFSARVVQPVYARNGALVVPRGSTVEGTVASVENSGSMSGESRIQLHFDRIVLPDGTSRPLRAEVSQVDGNQSFGGAITGTAQAGDEGGIERSQTRSTVGSAAAGGAAGAVIGAIAGGGKGAGIGGLLGAGLGVMLSSHSGGHLDLPAGTPLTITLDRPIRFQ